MQYGGRIVIVVLMLAAAVMLIKTLFPVVDPTQYAFLGPLVGARVTFWNFIVIATRSG